MIDKESFREFESREIEAESLQRFESFGRESFEESLKSAQLGARGYCVWQFGDKGWSVVKTRCGQGHDCGNPPTEKGKYKGEFKRKFCVPRTHQPQGADPKTLKKS